MPSRPKSEDYLEDLLHLRAIVGFIGQENLKGWWDTSLLETTGIRFLETIFPRSARLAALNSTVEAAGKVHDEATGRMGLFHLFRLPISLEDRISEVSRTVDLSEVLRGCEDIDSAIDRLKGFAPSGVSASEGPVQIGVERNILTKNSVEELAAHYSSAFDQEIQCFPYFGSGKSNG
tara:strand:- start:819 stop:1349 length:531 start_codon:yes stop_codon:yes gene_type:complete